MLDLPINVAQAKLQSEMITAIKKYEPRVEITSISFTGTEDGVLIPKVQVKIKDDNE